MSSDTPLFLTLLVVLLRADATLAARHPLDTLAAPTVPALSMIPTLPNPPLPPLPSTQLLPPLPTFACDVDDD